MILQPYIDDNDGGEASKSLFLLTGSGSKEQIWCLKNMIRLIIHILTANDIVLKFEQYY